MMLKLTKEPVTCFAKSAKQAPEPLGSLTWCYAPNACHLLPLLLLLWLVSSNVFADGTVYDEIAATDMLTEGFEVVRTGQGIDLVSPERFQNSRGEVEPITHLELEGPFQQVDSLEKGINLLSQIVRPEVDSEYKTSDMIYPGLGVSVVDVNGTKVAMLDYKMSKEPDTYVSRALIPSQNGLYSFAMSLHKSRPKDPAALRLVAIVIASVNSGKL